MAKRFFVLALTMGIVAGVASAQEGSGTFKFVNFNLGAAAGYSLDTSKLVGGVNFGLDFAVFDKLKVGVDMFNGAVTFSGLRIGYGITEKMAAGIGIGGSGSNPAITIGLGYNLFGGVSEVGIVHALKLRLDYIVPDVTDFAKGAVAVTLAASIGA